MKRFIAFLLTTALLLCTMSACSEDPAALIAKGDEAFAQNKLDEALNFYKQAGTEGDAKEKEVLMIQVRKNLAKESSYSFTYEEGDNLKKALEYLEENAKYSFETEEDRYAFLLDCLDQYLDDLRSEDADRYLARAHRWMYAAEYSAPKDSPALETFHQNQEAALNDANFAAGYQKMISNFAVHGYDIRSALADAQWYWDECTSGPGYECNNAIEKILTGTDYQAGLDVLAENITDAEVMAAIYRGLKAEISFENLDELFAFDALCREMAPEQESGKSLTESYSEIGTTPGKEFNLGNGHMDESVSVSLEELQAACGTKPDGRILFIHRPNGYEDFADLYLPLMNLLPSEYYPDSLESVEYVFWISCETIETGNTFGTTTKELREDTTVTVYDAKTGEILYQATEQGPTTMVMSYYGETPPSVYSHGAPYVGGMIKEALAVIEIAVS